MSKVLFIGIDGLDFGILSRWFGNNDLPNIFNVIKEGVKAPLSSVLPINSASAWSSLYTGRSPGEHGVFGFTKTLPNSYKRNTTNYNDINAPTFWEIANKTGAKVGLINCPLTYPPFPIDGFVISGIPIPYNQVWAYPKDLQDKVNDRFGNYIVDIPWANLADGVPGTYESFIAQMYQMMRKREEVALYTMKNYPWQIFAIVFTGSDRILHSFWHFTDENHPFYTEDGGRAFGREIKRYFVLLDEIIGRLVYHAGKETAVIIASDHGFGPLQYRFHIRTWLAQKGYLVKTSEELENVVVDETLKDIDWKKTYAFPASLSESGVWLNLRGRQPCGIVSESEYEKLRRRIANELRSFSQGGLKPIEKVYLREEALKGKFLVEAPDLFLEPNDGFIVDDSPSEEIFSFSTAETATHRAIGFFAAMGKAFAKGVALSELRITDVAPILLTASDLPIADDIEWTPSEGIFKEKPQIRRIKAEYQRAEVKQSLEEENAVKRQLKGLGYL